MSLLGIYTPFLYDSVNNLAAHYVKKTRYYRRALRTVTMSYRDTHSVYITNSLSCPTEFPHRVRLTQPKNLQRQFRFRFWAMLLLV